MLRVSVPISQVICVSCGFTRITRTVNFYLHIKTIDYNGEREIYNRILSADNIVYHIIIVSVKSEIWLFFDNRRFSWQMRVYTRRDR